MLLLLATSSLLIVVLFGVIEKRRNEKNIEKIPIRINVNGIRGKSTITRLITSTLTEAGYDTVGKTTGTASRIIYNQDEKELEIAREPRGVNIIEQIQVINLAATRNADALVCECMAVTPEYQRIYQDEMIKSNIGVIVNVLEDHIDLLGPTLDEVALSFLATIPYNGDLVVQNNEYTDFFKQEAKKRNTQVWVADESEIPPGYLEQFKTVIFPNNISIAYTVSKVLGIPREVALSGMLKMNPDPGTLQYHEIKSKKAEYTFANGFAINDPLSFLEMVDDIKEQYVINDRKEIYLMFNARKDRVDRSQQFIKDVFSKLDFPYHLIIIGESTKGFNKAVKNNKFKNMKSYHNYESKNTTETINDIESYINNSVIISVGNIHGKGYELLEYIEGKVHC